MHLIKQIVYCILFILFLTKCKKETDVSIPSSNIPIYDTAKIESYFPAYPKSYWKYLTLSGDTIIHQCSPTYNLVSNYNPINNPFDTIKYYASLYDSMIVKGYHLNLGSHSYHESGWKTLLPDSLYINNLFQECYFWPTTYQSGKIVAIDTSIIIKNHLYSNVIIVEEYTGPGIGAIKYGKTYYAKNIGIIKQEQVKIPSDTIQFMAELIDYKIGEK